MNFANSVTIELIATIWQILRASLVLVDSWLLEILFRYFDIFPSRKIFKMVRRAKSYPSEKLSPKPHFLLRHFLTFSIIARIIYALVCQTCYIRYHKIYSAKFKIGKRNLYFLFIKLHHSHIFQISSPPPRPHWICDLSLCGESANKIIRNGKKS